MAFKLIDIFDGNVVIGAHLDLESRHSVQHPLAILDLVRVGVQKIINFLVVKLNVLATDGNFVYVTEEFSTFFDGFE
jgi:hypothetical protein